MTRSESKTQVYVEIGKKRTFAGAIDWPGWCRSGRDEHTALSLLSDYGPRYARVLQATQLGFKPPKDAAAFVVTSRLMGDSTTDFGSPAIAPPTDDQSIDDTELQRFLAILRACWRAFEQAVEAAHGVELRKGPRGGGRDLQKMIHHVLEANEAYLGRLGWKFNIEQGEELSRQLDLSRQVVLEALEANAAIETPTVGPRGGVRWMPRYFVRRVAWHLLDHVWEIEDRMI